MHILGIANGTPGGNSEILLKTALVAARKTRPSITTSWIHAPSVLIPPNPKPLQGSLDISMGAMDSMKGQATEKGVIPDDRHAVLNAILDADALIISTPVYSHAPAGMLKALTDRIMGPYTDAAFAKRVSDSKEAGDATFDNQNIDGRVSKPRAVGFIAVAGSITPDQVSLALPTLHLLVYSLHAKVVDQEVFTGHISPGSVVFKDGGEALIRAQGVGRNVASQLGKQFDDCQYLGPQPPGACPYCHLSKIDLFCEKDNKIGCVVCGAEGHLSMGADNVIRPVWAQNCGISSITMAGKQKHIVDLVKSGIQEAESLKGDQDMEMKISRWRDVQIPIVTLPSDSKL